MKNRGFTLIELIVVITILAILGTIAFIGLKGYTGDARNSKITTDIANLHNSLAILKATEGVVPMPDSAKEVKTTEKVITYEGEVGDNVRNTLKASSDTKTPTGENYKYAVNGSQKQFTLVGVLEEESAMLGTTAFAEDGGDTVMFKGDNVLTLFDTNNNFIGGIVDDGSLGSTTKIYLGDKEMSLNAGSVDKLPLSIKENRGLTFNSCKAILDYGYSKGDGEYEIVAGGTKLNVYCDMTTNGGGWTKYAEIKGNYSYSNSVDCITKKDVLNTDKLYCFNPNQYGITGDKIRLTALEAYSSVNIGDNFYIDINSSVELDSKTTYPHSAGELTCTGHQSYMSDMHPTNDIHWKNFSYQKGWARLGSNYCDYEIQKHRNIGGVTLESDGDTLYMNYSKKTDGTNGPNTSPHRSKDAKKWEFWIK